MIDRSNDLLDDKASKIFQSSSLIIALTGLLASPLIGASLAGVPFVLVSLIMIAFMAMIGLSVASVSPKSHYLPGSQNWNTNFEQYILVNTEEALNQILSDCIQTIDLLSKTNSVKAKFVRVSASLLIMQLGALLLFLFLSVQ
jgi:hypothetical protein